MSYLSSYPHFTPLHGDALRSSPYEAPLTGYPGAGSSLFEADRYGSDIRAQRSFSDPGWPFGSRSPLGHNYLSSYPSRDAPRTTSPLPTSLGYGRDPLNDYRSGYARDPLTDYRSAYPPLRDEFRPPYPSASRFDRLSRDLPRDDYRAPLSEPYGLSRDPLRTDPRNYGSTLTPGFTSEGLRDGYRSTLSYAREEYSAPATGYAGEGLRDPYRPTSAYTREDYSIPATGYSREPMSLDAYRAAHLGSVEGMRDRYPSSSSADPLRAGYSFPTDRSAFAGYSREPALNDPYRAPLARDPLSGGYREPLDVYRPSALTAQREPLREDAYRTALPAQREPLREDAYRSAGLSAQREPLRDDLYRSSALPAQREVPREDTYRTSAATGYSREILREDPHRPTPAAGYSREILCEDPHRPTAATGYSREILREDSHRPTAATGYSREILREDSHRPTAATGYSREILREDPHRPTAAAGTSRQEVSARKDEQLIPPAPPLAERLRAREGK
eukprot:NODE_1041_length_1691_cov_26.510230_g978_i0.p1 GENE.NODE_1041_length_1691_cov_26.510230_g978_i0~~NODE_1041_length_1691_cov_26.510230_g978_i0.p1  ORF type:complete len:505 (+),score=0.11 NODE_1041_length_1691_cov_26.510230_g978_i0:44-1558(+)